MDTSCEYAGQVRLWSSPMTFDRVMSIEEIFSFRSLIFQQLIVHIQRKFAIWTLKRKLAIVQ
jgi:hypothetical protein